jgi:hypothetical protein
VNGDTVAALAAMLVVALAVFFMLVFAMGAVDAGDAGVFIESRWWVASISVVVGVVGAWLVEDVPAAAVLFLVAAGIGAGMALVGFIALRKGLAT